MNIKTALLAALFTTGCYTWKPVGLEENTNAATRPSEVEIVLKGGYQGTVYAPVVRGDSLHGWQDVKQKSAVAFLVTDIKSARTSQLHGPRTAAVVVVSAVATLGLWFMIALSNADWSGVGF